MPHQKRLSTVPRRVQQLTGISAKARAGRGNPRFAAQRKAAAGVIRQARKFTRKPPTAKPKKRKGLLPLNPQAARAADKRMPATKITIKGPGALQKAKKIALNRAKRGLGTKVTKQKAPKPPPFKPKKAATLGETFTRARKLLRGKK